MFRRILGAGITISLWLMVSGIQVTVLAAERPDISPDQIEGATKVNAEDVFRLFESTPNLVIIDSRLADGPSSGRAQGFIEGSVSLPDTQTDCTSLARVLPKKTTPALFYCNGPKCGRSVTGIKVALSCGYKNLYWFRGGFEEWRDKGYPIVKK